MNDKETEILCPCENCDVNINYDKITEILCDNESLLDKYNEILDETELIKNFNASVCNVCGRICKKSTDNNYVYCNSCENDYCFICKESHDDYDNCPNEEEMNNIIDELQSIFDAVNINYCPMCRIILYKEEGCAATRCKHCKIKFCWECRRTQHQIKKLKKHNCQSFDRYLNTNSDDEYTSGSDLSDNE